MFTKIAFFAHPTKNVDVAKNFYQNVLGLKLAKTYGEGKWLEFVLPDGKTLAVESFSSDGPYVALETDNILEEMARLKQRGAKIIKDTWENTDSDNQMVCKMSVIADPDGNHILLHEIAANRR